ncbi:MAG: phosphate/phosphite/phosphonate ABC transporter substrate-binding protein [Trueperaceae bacterium]|nr:MAG: phosphate/phosphite/phosphonate ABC transporter substrate-binding protein [Trueperaceae bacterium]
MKRLFVTLGAALLIAGLFGTSQAQGDVPDRLVLGMVPSREADVIVDSLGPIADLLSQALLIPVDTFVSTNFVGLVEAVGTGRVDIGLFGPAALVQAMDVHGAEVILASVRRGSTTYRAQFNVRCDSGITEFEQLRGGTIAFVDPGSASGYQFPFVTLSQTHGINPDTEMTAIFAGSHDAAALAVYLGDVDVAVTFGGSPGSDGRETIEADFPDVKDVVCILGFSDNIPNDGTVVRSGLDPELVEQITQAMIDLASTEEGQVLTQALFNVTEFARIDASAYDIVRDVSATFAR